MAGFILNLSKVHAQVLYTISGKVVDARNGSPLAFVNIQVNDKMIGTVSDIDGNFHFSSSQPIDKLQFSYIGYETLVLERSSLKQKITVKLRKTEIELKEVTIYPGQNPALRIIRNAINNRKRNNIENLSGFSYNAYEKTVFSIKADSLLLADTNSLDTNLRRLREFINRQHLLVIENYIDRQFQSPNKNIEKVVATKVSGLKDPIFVFCLANFNRVHFMKTFLALVAKTLLILWPKTV
ncbi:MAG TPA: carboxypeptidase-like regulatory domain-containing protein [Bacteroidales bacterium]|nr:carboxypeptidase-like regulatory domain-containing protein [Bacteroidales bacterium]